MIFNIMQSTQVNLIIPEGKTKMIVQLFDEDKRKEDLISEGEIDLTYVLKNGEQDGKEVNQRERPNA